MSWAFNKFSLIIPLAIELALWVRLNPLWGLDGRMAASPVGLNKLFY